MTLRRTLLPLALAGALVASGACGDGGGTPPGTLRFGQIGEIRLHLVSPLRFGEGELQQALTWNSTGPWQLTESISYEGVLGDENTVRSAVPAEVLASEYAIWITQVHDVGTLNLFDPVVVDPELMPECGSTNTRITLTIRDDGLGQTREWQRCVEGTLSSFVTAGAGPDPGAARVANAALLVRDYIFPAPRSFTSTFHGSFPFATLARGDDTPADLGAPFVVRSQSAFNQFWTQHTGGTQGMPKVDFPLEAVLIVGIGVRPEAGETIEVRRVLPVGTGTVVEIVHRVPGNFCSPVARAHTPFHVVVTPNLPEPITFADVVREEVPCG